MLNSNTFEMERRRWFVILRNYWQLIKDLQTGLLLITGLAGYMSGDPATIGWRTVLSLLGSLFLTVGGSTVLNMVMDRDIDAKMQRTCHRPLADGTIHPHGAVTLGSGMVVIGLIWALLMNPLYGLVVAVGMFFDVFVYTRWLKRRTPWSILWGGMAGGMPVLAGRVLAVGRIDGIGLGLALAILLWIPTHIVTFAVKYAEDYQKAGVPVLPNTYGLSVTRFIIGLSTAAAVMTMLGVMYRLNLTAVLMWIARGLGGLLFGYTLVALARSSSKLNMLLYKAASFYMLGSMIILIASV
jgi:protoheme IX farnesyltransferase